MVTDTVAAAVDVAARGAANHAVPEMTATAVCAQLLRRGETSSLVTKLEP